MAGISILFMALVSRFLITLMKGNIVWMLQVFLTNADSLMFGCLLALAFGSQRAKMTDAFRYRPALGRLVAVLLIFLPLVFRPGAYLVFSPTIQAPAIAYLIGSYIVVRRGMGYSLLNHPLPAYLGTLSYSIYLWQQFFLVSPQVMNVYWFQAFPQNLGFIFIFAMFSFYAIERPFLNLKARFSRISEKEGAVRHDESVEGFGTQISLSPR